MYSYDNFPLKQSAITCICKTKLGSGLSSGLLEYLIEFSATSLISAVKASLAIDPEYQTPENQCSTWIPASVLSHYLPQMVAEQHLISPKLHARASASSRLDSKQVCIIPQCVLNAYQYDIDFHHTTSIVLVITPSIHFLKL